MAACRRRPEWLLHPCGALEQAGTALSQGVTEVGLNGPQERAEEFAVVALVDGVEVHRDLLLTFRAVPARVLQDLFAQILAALVEYARAQT